MSVTTSLHFGFGHEASSSFHLQPAAASANRRKLSHKLWVFHPLCVSSRAPPVQQEVHSEFLIIEQLPASLQVGQTSEQTEVVTVVLVLRPSSTRATNYSDSGPHQLNKHQRVNYILTGHFLFPPSRILPTGIPEAGVGRCSRYFEAFIFTGIGSGVNGPSRWESCVNLH